MTQDEVNKELDRLLGELIFNGDITRATTPAEMKEILLAQATGVSEEQWLNYCTYCLQTTVEEDLKKKPQQRIN